MYRHEMKAQSSPLSDRKLTIVFGLDESLVLQSSPTDEARLYLLRKSAILSAEEQDYLVVPGVLELMSFLFAKSNVRVAFYSSGLKTRNQELIRKLLIKALGQEKYDLIKSAIIILSADDLSSCSAQESNEMLKNFGINASFRKKKDISKALSENGIIDSTILVDDCLSIIHYQQEKNFLRCPTAIIDYQRDFEALEKAKSEPGHYRYLQEQLFYKHNTIFLVTGVLADCITLFEKGEHGTELLFSLHFKKADDFFFQYEPSRELVEEKKFYMKGLITLQQCEPALSFVTYEDYVSTLEMKQTKEESNCLAPSRAKETSEGTCFLL